MSAPAALEIFGSERQTDLTDGVQRRFETLADGVYCLSLKDLGISLTVDRLRRDRQELVGELCVRCELAGARLVDGALSTADMNFSSARARSDRGKLLQERSRAKDVDWIGLVEELAQRVLTAERAGAPSVSLRDLPRPDGSGAEFELLGFHLPRRHPCILFGDGGAAKSYIALKLLADLAECGLRVGYFDWELSGEDHRERLGRLCASVLPDIRYVRCERPLIHEADRLRRLVLADKIEFAVFDSVAFATDGPPEAAESAAAYFRAVRQIGEIGSLHVAHVTKSEGGDQKPFGSTFWHNGARRTYFVKATDSSGGALSVGVFPRKANLAQKGPAFALSLRFDAERTTITDGLITDVPDLAADLPVKQRIVHLVKQGNRSAQEIAEELGERLDTVQRTISHYQGKPFTIITGGNGKKLVGLLEQRLA